MYEYVFRTLPRGNSGDRCGFSPTAGCMRENSESRHVTQELLPDEAHELLRLCKAGRLYDVEKWIRAGRSLSVPGTLKKTPLGVALESGSHSLVELLLRHEDSQLARNDALAHAVRSRRTDLVELTLRYGADPSSVTFFDVLMSWDKVIAERFLERGADFVGDLLFAHAFHERVRTAIGIFLDCKRRWPELGPKLQEQADIALRQHCHDGNLKWVSLLVWAGADPTSVGPTIEYLDDDPEMYTTALAEACNHGDVEVVKRLKPDPGRDNLGALLSEAAFGAHTAVLAYLLELKADPNDKDDGGSTALDRCLWHLRMEDTNVLWFGRRNRRTPSYEVRDSRDSIRLLIEHGARWTPASSMDDVRRTFYGIEPDVTVEFVELLVRHQACDDATLHDLLRTPRMQQHLASCEQRLHRLGLTLAGLRRPETQRGIPPLSPHVLARYSRERLYDEVWLEPTEQVAARYGVSGAFLARVCRQMRIPKPPRGYWAKKKAGVRLPARPKLGPLTDERARIRGRRR